MITLTTKIKKLNKKFNTGIIYVPAKLMKEFGLDDKMVNITIQVVK